LCSLIWKKIDSRTQGVLLSAKSQNEECFLENRVCSLARQYAMMDMTRNTEQICMRLVQHGFLQNIWKGGRK